MAINYEQELDRLVHKFNGRWVSDKPVFPSDFHQDKFDEAVADLKRKIQSEEETR